MDEPLNADSFAEMLNGPADTDQPGEPESQNDEAEQEENDETATDEEADDASADAEPAPEPEPEEQPEKDSADAFLELEINGEKVKVSRDEAKNGYLRQQDYTQKAQNLARERQEGQAHIEQQFKQVQQYSAELGQLNQLDTQVAQYQQVDWQALRNDDPTSYNMHLAEFNDLRMRRGEMAQAIGHKQQALTQQAEQARQQAFMQQTQEAQAHLATVIPGFGKEHVAQMKESGIKHGFTAAELSSIADGRMMEVLWKASQYDAGKATAAKAVKAVAALPTKASKPAPASKPAADMQIDKQRQRVAQTGSARDFAALLDMATPKRK